MDKKIDERIVRTMKALEENNMLSFYCETSAEAREKVKELISTGEVISSGGSMTLNETGIIDIIKSADYKYIDRSEAGISQEEADKRVREVFFADTYFASANAVTENGEVYNVDGNCNRVAAILFGPKSVILVVGKNKIVKNLEEAIVRVKKCAAPPNTVRLNKNTYCAVNAECLSCRNNPEDMTAGCKSPDRICCSYTVLGQQRFKNRIKVIIVGEDLGY